TWDFPVCRRASAYAVSARSGGRVAEGGGLLNRYRGLNPYRGFESPPLRHFGLRKRRFLPLFPMRRIRCAHAQESCAPDRKRDERLWVTVRTAAAFPPQQSNFDACLDPPVRVFQLMC